MPALPPVADVIKSQLVWSVEGDPMAVTNFFWHYTGGPPASSDLNTLCALMTTSGATEFAALMSDNMELLGANARDLSSDMANTGTSAASTGGSRTGGNLPPGTCALANYHQPRSYRGGKPRGYFPFGTATDVSAAGLWEGSFVTAYEGAVTAFVADIVGFTSASFDVDYQCNVSYYGPPNIVVTNPVTGRARTVSTRRSSPIVTKISGWAGTAKIGSQRRRNKAA